MEAIANVKVNNNSNLMEATRAKSNLNLIASKDEEYCFIMKLTTNGEIEHLDTAIKFEAHDIYTHGDYEAVMRCWEHLVNRIRMAEAREDAEVLYQEEGGNYLRIAVVKGTDLIVYTACAKKVAKALAY